MQHPTIQLDLVIPWWDPKLISRGTDTTQGGNTWSFSCLFSQVFKFHLPCKLLQAHCSPSYSGAGENTGLRQQNCYHLPLLLNLMVLWPRALSWGGISWVSPSSQQLWASPRINSRGIKGVSPPTKAGWPMECLPQNPTEVDVYWNRSWDPPSELLN